MRYLGQWEERCDEMVNELEGIDGTLTFNSLQDLITTGSGTAHSGLAAYFMHFIKAKRLRMVVEATPDELKAARRQLPEFLRLFKIQTLQPLPKSSDIEIILTSLTNKAKTFDIELGDGVAAAL